MPFETSAPAPDSARSGAGCLAFLLGMLAMFAAYIFFVVDCFSNAHGCDGGTCTLCILGPLLEPTQLAWTFAIGVGTAVVVILLRKRSLYLERRSDVDET